MGFQRQTAKNHYLHDTRVENMFINEYMVSAPGDYVKVFLYGLMYADLSMPLENDMIARELSLEEEQVLMAWNYWEKQGVIRKHYPDPNNKFRYEVVFIDLKEQLYGAKGAAKAAGKKEVPPHLKKQLDDSSMRDMFAEIERITGRFLSGNEPANIQNWIIDHGITPEVVIFAYSYCQNQRGGKNQYQYVNTVIRDWVDKGLKNINDIETYLTESDNRHFQYKRVMKALGFTRNSTEEEKRIMDVWFNEYGFGLETVLEACKKTSGISSPNINYVNTILTSWYKGEDRKKPSAGGADRAAGGASDNGDRIRRVMKSYEEDRERNDRLWKERTEEIYEKIPQIRQIDSDLHEL
ncbi:MAG: DnaD domain protein, partial [Firmicutes bacterium]|nr:DnaD domain protein [Bacillota bacterium]